MKPEERVILALDVSPDRAEYFLDLAREFIKTVKIGPVLFFSMGEKVVTMTKERNLDVFLDFKHMDIPNTVSLTADVISKMGVKMFTVHCLGGREMLWATREKLQKLNSPPLMIGVTVLTSWDQHYLERLGFSITLTDLTIKLVQEGREGGVDGFVCSPLEVKTLKKLAPDKIFITPGIRLQKATDDQKRISTPLNAVKNGADYIVVGRPVLQAEHPDKVLREIIEEVKSADNIRS